MTTRAADIDLLIECAKEFARLLGVTVPEEARIRQGIQKAIEERGAITSAEMGLITRDEAVSLLLAHLHSDLFMLSGTEPASEPCTNPEFLSAVKRGLFGPTHAG